MAHVMFLLQRVVHGPGTYRGHLQGLCGPSPAFFSVKVFQGPEGDVCRTDVVPYKRPYGAGVTLDVNLDNVSSSSSLLRRGSEFRGSQFLPTES